MRRGKGKNTTSPLNSEPIPEWAGLVGGGHADEVEELLRVAQDDVFLRLNVNSHRLHSSSGLDSDLGRRFAALQIPSKQLSNPSVPCKKPEKLGGQVADGKSDDVLGAELSARFLALKGSMKGEEGETLKKPLDSFSMAAAAADHGEEDFESEVQKLLEWAKDAARLDPSQSDEEGVGVVDSDDYDDDDDEDDASDDDRGEMKMKGKLGKKESSKRK